MRFYVIHILRKASNDVVVPHWWNKKLIENLFFDKYISSLGQAKSGKMKGKEGFLITKKGETYLAELQAESKEERRFWITVIASALSGAIGFILGKLFP